MMKQFHLGRKGEAEEMETLTLFDIIIGLAVAVMLILVTVSYTGLSGIGKMYVESDLSLMVSALLSAPGQITARYPLSPDYKIAGICSDDSEECKKIKVYSTSSLLGAFKKDNIVFNANPERGIYEIKRVANE